MYVVFAFKINNFEFYEVLVSVLHLEQINLQTVWEFSDKLKEMTS